MESGIKSDVNVPEFRPIMEDFSNFKEYIDKLEKQNLSFAKVSISTASSLRFKLKHHAGNLSKE